MTKIQQFLGIITVDKPVNYSQYSGQVFEYSNNIQNFNPNIRGNSGIIDLRNPELKED